MVGLMGGPGVSLGNVVGSFPLGLESDSLFVPFIDSGGDGVHRHDSSHEWGGNSGREVPDEDIRVRDVGEGDVVFEGGNVFCQRGGVRVVLLALLHSLGGKPGDGVPGDVVVLERGVELGDEVSESSEGKRCSRDSALAEGRGPSEGRSFGHVQKSKSDLLIVIVVNCFVDKEVELHSVQPVLRFLIGSIERFRGADA